MTKIGQSTIFAVDTASSSALGSPIQQELAFVVLGFLLASYRKPYLSIPQQIDLLQRRGMHVPDRVKAAEYLSRLGYYRLSAFWYQFRQIDTVYIGNVFVGDKFKGTTEFDAVKDLYIFDKGLRLIVLDAIERIEIAIRTQIALTIGRRDPWGHRDPNQLDAKFMYAGPGGVPKHTEWLSRLDHRAATSKEEYAEHFRSFYSQSDMPIWIAVELLDFGPLSHLLSGMRFGDVRKIGIFFNISAPLITSWVRALSGVRNVCAHHARTWNRPLVDQPKLPAKDTPDLLRHVLNGETGATRIYAALAIARYLLLQANPRSQWHYRLKNHVSTFPNNPNLSLEASGFPTGWQNLPLWL